MNLAMRTGLIIGLLIVMAPALADPASETGLAAQFARAFLAGREFDIPEDELDMARARAVQASYVELLIPERGPVAGFKAGLTNPVAQARFGIGQPVRGTLLRDMLMPSPAQIGIYQGARLAVEADLLVRVGDPAINRAQTNTELLAALDAVIPFIEVPDLMFPQGSGMSVELLVAANVGARFGIMGEPIPLPAGTDTGQRLSDFDVVLIDANRKVLASGKGRDLLGDPVKAVRWLRDELVSSGIRLRAGDLLSLGSLTPLLPAAGGQTFHARYRGLNQLQEQEVTVRFDSPQN